MPSACGIGGDAFWLIWDAAGARPVRAQRLRTGARRGECRGAAGPRALHDPAPRTPGRHGPGRRPVVGRRARPVRPSVPRRRPRAGDRAGPGRVPGLGRLHLGGRGDDPDRRSRPSALMPRSRRSTGRTAGRGDPARWSGSRPWRRPSSAWPSRASTRSTTATSGHARRPRSAPLGGTHSRRRLPGPPLHVGPADRDDLPRRAGHEPPAERVRPRGPRAPQHPRGGRRTGPGGVRRAARSPTRPGSTGRSRPRSWRWPIATPT